MRIVVLSSCGAFDRYLIQELSRGGRLSHVIRVRWDSNQRAGRRKMFRRPVDTLIRGLERRLYFARRRTWVEAQLALQLGSPPDPETLISVTPILSREVNAGRGAELLQQLAPDFLITSAAPILKPATFNVTRYGAINVHRGVAPDHRGEHCLFWALYDRDRSALGVTIHRLDEGIDTGKVVAREILSVNPSDDEVSVLAKAARSAAHLVVDFIAGGPPWPEGLRLEGTGVLHREADRRIWHDVACRWRLRRRPLPDQCGTIEHFALQQSHGPSQAESR